MVMFSAPSRPRFAFPRARGARPLRGEEGLYHMRLTCRRDSDIALAAPEFERVDEDVLGDLDEEALVQADARRRRAAALAERGELPAEREELGPGDLDVGRPSAGRANGGEEVGRGRLIVESREGLNETTSPRRTSGPAACARPSAAGRR